MENAAKLCSTPESDKSQCAHLLSGWSETARSLPNDDVLAFWKAMDGTVCDLVCEARALQDRITSDSDLEPDHINEGPVKHLTDALHGFGESLTGSYQVALKGLCASISLDQAGSELSHIMQQNPLALHNLAKLLKAFKVGVLPFKQATGVKTTMIQSRLSRLD